VIEALGMHNASDADQIETTKVAINPVEHLGLVRSVAAKYAPKGTPVEDTEEYADGVLGLLRACEAYDATQGLFSTVAWKAIQTAIIQGWRKKGRQKRTGVVVSIEEKNADPVDARLDLSNIGQVVARFMEPHPDDTEADLRCKKVVFEHFINEKTWAEIGLDMGFSRARAQQLGVRGIELLRHRFKVDELTTVEEMLDDF
jgi:RNA polymerase sigma factor (sigma-70 family)